MGKRKEYGSENSAQKGCYTPDIEKAMKLVRHDFRLAFPVFIIGVVIGMVIMFTILR